MSKLDSKLALREFLFNVSKNDQIKARYILSYIQEIDKKEQHGLLLALSRSEDHFAIPLLSYLMSEHPQIYQNFPTLKETLHQKILDNRDFFLKLLRMPSTEQITYIQLSAELKLYESVQALKTILDQQKDKAVLKNALKALGDLASAEDFFVFEKFFSSAEDDLVKTSIYALKQNNSAKALDFLFEHLGINRKNNQHILDVFVEIQSQYSLELLNKALKTGNTMLRNQARDKIIGLGHKAIGLMAQNLLIAGSDLQILSLEILSSINSPECVAPIRKLLHAYPADANVRFSAFEALGSLPMPKGTYILAQGLTDPSSQVRLAAIKAIDSHFNPQLAAGLANITRDQGKDSREVIETILTGFSDTIFLSLLTSDNFWSNARDYLTGLAHPEVSKHYYNLLLSKGYNNYARQLLDQKPSDSSRRKACVVDDSPMILNIYRSILHELQFDPVLFKSATKALSWLKDEKPAILFTDLNMPGMTGTELVTKIRQWYAKKDLPIILVTSEQNRQNREQAYQAGINALLNKPFNLESIQAVLSPLL